VPRLLCLAVLGRATGPVLLAVTGMCLSQK